jgi:hypothetical protein
MKDLYYEITENGYHIYDRNDPLFHVHQFEPYIRDKSKTYEENAQEHIHIIMVSYYVSQVMNEAITLEEVPEEYLEEVTTYVEELSGTETDEDEATEQDYINALAELGVTDDEESGN